MVLTSLPYNVIPSYIKKKPTPKREVFFGANARNLLFRSLRVLKIPPGILPGGICYFQEGHHTIIHETLVK
jgi:hypothetical protein